MDPTALAIGAALTLCAGAGLFFGCYQLASSGGLLKLAAALFVDVIWPEIIKSSPETQAASQKRAREGTERGGKDR